MTKPTRRSQTRAPIKGLDLTPNLPAVSPVKVRRAQIDLVPVRLEVKVTEVGTLELWSASTDSKQRWRLEYNVRQEIE